MSLTAIAEPVRPRLDCVVDDGSLSDEVVQATKPIVSRTQVKRAGNVLAKHIPEPKTEAEKNELGRWFRIAHDWRRAHIVPMNVIRAELNRKVKRLNNELPPVARLKRMGSIRRKLPGRSLHQLQDIGGCRAIFWSMDDLLSVLSAYRNGDTRHEWHDDDDYISNPKPDGYRSHHVVLKFQGTETTRAYDGLRIEVQLRSKLQHAWATAVEAVGAYRNEHLKFGQGDARWLKFFTLMASEMAVVENLPLVPSVSSDQHERRQEIEALNNDLSALRTLNGFRNTVRETELRGPSSATFFLVEYDRTGNTVSILPYGDVLRGAAAYDTEEYSEMFKSMPKNAVLIQADSIEHIRATYPNYFLDVGIFVSGLRNVLKGKPIEVPSRRNVRTWSFDPKSVLEAWQQRR